MVLSVVTFDLFDRAALEEGVVSVDRIVELRFEDDLFERSEGTISVSTFLSFVYVFLFETSLLPAE